MSSRRETGRLVRCGVLAAVALAAQAQPVERSAIPPPARAQSAGAETQDGLRTTVYRGRELTYEVIDGWAVHDGDIVLGRAEEMEPAQAGVGPEGGGIPGPDSRRDLSPVSEDRLWPDGIIPYEIIEDATPEERRAVLVAITEWNVRTVIQFVPRTGQAQYARLIRHPPGRFCASMVGRGSPTLVQTVGCNHHAIVHELGHAIGLWHEHQRSDAEEYGMWSEPVGDAMDLSRRGGSLFPIDDRHGYGPFDLRSIMIYGIDETIPPGMLKGGGAGLSAGDVVGVNRLYGEPSQATVVTTNPPGLEIVVDGYRVETPATFFWPDGSDHVLEAPMWQVSGEAYGPLTRNMFGRWTDGGDRVHQFTAGPGETWVEASFIRQEQFQRKFRPSGFPDRPPDRVQFEDNFNGFDATPRALTFIYEAGATLAAQVVRLTNRTGEQRRYDVSADSLWLVADPSEASLGPGESVDIEVSVLPTGLPAETYSGELRVRPSGLDSAELQQIPGMPAALVVLPEILPVRLGTSGGTVEVAVSATEGFLGVDGRPLGRGGRVTTPNGDTYVLAKVPGGVSATVELGRQTLDLPAGETVTLTQHGVGDWRIGGDRIFSGHVHAAGGHDYVLELAGGSWRVAPYAIRKLAGLGLGPDGISATKSAFHQPSDVAVDAAGNLYVVDSTTVRRIGLGGTITTVAGTGELGYSGDGGPAWKARLNYPQGVAVDAAGNVFVADNHRVRKIDASGTIMTVAGTGRLGYGGDGGPATEALFEYPQGVAVDAAGNVFVADSGNGRVRKIDASGTITTVAGTGEVGYGGDGGPATEALFGRPVGVAVDAAGNLFVADIWDRRVRKIDASGTITTVVGTGESGYGGDGGPATEALLSNPVGVAADTAGNVFVADSGNGRVRKIDASGTITTVAGTGEFGYGGDGGPATEALLNNPVGVAVDAAGNVFVADSRNYRVRKIDVSGMIATWAGTGEYGVDRVVASGIAVDSSRNVYLADFENHRVRKIDASGTITTVAGTGRFGYGGDGGPATEALFEYPRDVAVDAAGNVFVADNHRVRKIDASGTITTLAGTGQRGFGGDGGPATEALLSAPVGVAVDAAGNVYVADSGNERVRKIDASGTITTVAGTGEFGYAGDGGPATEALLSNPVGVAADTAGNVYVVDHRNERVRKIDASGTITTLADLRARIRAIAVDGEGLVYVGGYRGYRDAEVFDGSESSAFRRSGYIWMIHPRDGRAVVIAGGAERWFGSDGPVEDIAVDWSGKIWFANDGRVRVLEPIPAPSQAQVRLPGGGTVQLTKQRDGSGWRIGDTPVENGHVYVDGGTEYVLLRVGEQWRVAAANVPLGTSGESMEVEVLANGTLMDKRTSQPFTSGSLVTASNLDTYLVTAGSGGISTTLVPRSQTAQFRHGSSLFIGGWEYRLMHVRGVWSATAVRPAYSIRSVAGSTAVAEGVAATAASLFRPSGIAVDAVGNLFVADTRHHRIRQVDLAGVFRTVAGSGEGGYSGDGVSATGASLSHPTGVAVDTAGNLYVADSWNDRVRKIDAARAITTLAGTGVRRYSGDGGPASRASLSHPTDVAVDTAGNLYLADTGSNRLRKVDAASVITTLAGTGESGYGGDGGPATEALLSEPRGVAVDTAGNLYVADSGNDRVRKIDASGTITTLAGTGESGYGGDGGSATGASLSHPTGVAVDAAGNLYLADTGNNRLRKVDAAGVITTLAGTGEADHGGDGGPATSASLSEPRGVAVDTAGNLYVADAYNNRVRKVAVSGTITTVAGDGNEIGESEGGLADQAKFQAPSSITVDGAGNVFFLDAQRIWKLDSFGQVTRVAGGGSRTSYGDGIPATAARLVSPVGVAVDTAGNLYVAASSGDIFKIDSAGTLTVLANVGSAIAIAADAAGNVYVAEENPVLVRKIGPDGTVTTLAGGGEDRTDGVAATEADLGQSDGRLAVDAAGNVYVAATVDGSSKVRKIDTAAGTISTVGSLWGSVAVDGAGNVYVGGGNRIRRIDPDGSVWVIAGTGQEGFNGDGDVAAVAKLSVSATAVDRFGTVWFADPFNRRIRALDPAQAGN